jgi:hypothetical protein
MIELQRRQAVWPSQQRLHQRAVAGSIRVYRQRPADVPHRHVVGRRDLLQARHVRAEVRAGKRVQVHLARALGATFRLVLELHLVDQEPELGQRLHARHGTRATRL